MMEDLVAGQLPVRVYSTWHLIPGRDEIAARIAASMASVPEAFMRLTSEAMGLGAAEAEIIAKLSYKLADAILKEREQK